MKKYIVFILCFLMILTLWGCGGKDNSQTNADNKVDEVTPPKNLISEKDAKIVVFTHAGVSADDVTSFSIELEFDEDFYGWKYCINFTANDKNYEAEVNAVSRTILKFRF